MMVLKPAITATLSHCQLLGFKSKLFKLYKNMILFNENNVLKNIILIKI